MKSLSEAAIGFATGFGAASSTILPAPVGTILFLGCALACATFITIKIVEVEREARLQAQGD